MLPEVWGSYAWRFLHCVTIEYPTNPTRDDMENFRTFFDSLKYVLPCEKCRKNFAKHMKKYPLTDEVLSTKKNLIRWCIDLHNVVNYDTGKKMLSYSETIHDLHNFTMSKIKKVKKNNTVFYGLLIIGIIIIVVFFYMYNRNIQPTKIS